MSTERDPSSKELGVVPGPELRLLDRRAFVGFPALTVVPGLSILDFALQIPDVTFPFSFSGGASRYQKKKLAFGFLEVQVEAELVARQVAQVAGRIPELDGLKLHFRPGYIEGQARLTQGDRVPLTFKIAFDGDGERLALYVYDVRLYGFSTTPASFVPVLLSRAVRDLQLLPDVETRGATGFSARILPALVELAAVGRGYKMPLLDQARLSAAEVTGQGLKLRFSAGGLPPPIAPDEELLLALEGARAFADAENLLAQGKLAEARESYLRLGDVTEAHPFAIERLLTLLVADPQAQEMVLDVAATLIRRREKSATALWAEAVVRERRGESARAAERYLALCSVARRHQEDASGFFAAESAARAARDQAPQMAVKALHEVLGLKPDHLPSLQALARAADQAHDRAGAIRAWRRIAALARDPAEAADAHVQMARLSALTEDDVAGARLHCEAALRLAPNHPDALYLLGELCHRAGEHLRAIKALDRLREVAMGRHEVDRVGHASVLAGRVWEEGLKQPENALLRYREAVSLLPGEPEPLYLSARVAEGLGKLQEAVSGYQQAIELAGPAPRDEQVRKTAHAAHHAMARLYKTRLGEPVRAREHLEAALTLDPRDLGALEELLPYFRATGRTADLADALEKAAAVVEEPSRRAALWAEAGELYRGRLGKPEHAEQLLALALEADPRNRTALEGMLALAESHRDGARLCHCLEALAELEQDPAVRVRHLRRLAVAARDLAFDLDLAASALTRVLGVEPNDLTALGELCALHRRRSDMNGLALALEQRARVAEAQGDKRLAAAALRELAQVLEARLGRVAEALVALEKAARLSPDSALLLELADLSLRCDRPQHARRALEDLLAQMPASAAPERVAEVRARLGRACELLGDKDGAKDHYAQAFPLRRMDDELAGRLEALYEEAGDTVALAELWAARAQAFAAADRAHDAAPLFLRSARALLRAGERSTAILRLNAAFDAAPEGPHAGEILEAMAELELERGGRREAARLLARRAALIADPRAAARLYWRAAQLAQGQSREDEYLAEALRREPRFAPARIRRGELAAEKDPRAALEDLEAVLSLDDSDPDAPRDGDRLDLTRKAATVAARAGRTDTARRLLGLYAARRPDDLGAWKELAELHRRVGATDALCDLLSELWHRLEGDEQNAALREYAELCLSFERTGAGIDALRALRELEPGNLWAAAKLLPLLPADASDAERLSLLSILLTAADGAERSELLARRAALHRAAGDLEAARDDLRAAIATAPEPAVLLRELAELSREAKDPRAELEAWSEAVQRDEALAGLAAGRVLEIAHAALRGDVVLARAAFERALALPLADADRCEAGFGLADAAEGQGDLPGAAEALREAARQGAPARRVEALLRRAALLERTGAAADAATAFEAALALSPLHADALAGLKRALRQLERWAALADVLAREAAAAPAAEAARLQIELGRLLLERLGREADAEVAFRRAAHLDERDADVRKQLCAILSARGEWTEAAVFAEQAAALVSTSDAAALLRETGLGARDGGAVELALRLLRRAHELEPSEGAALAALAELLYLKGAVREALPLARTLAATADFADDPDRAEASLLRLAELTDQIGEAQEAEAALRRVIAERPLSGAAAERLSELLASRSPRESVEVLWTWARTLTASERTFGLLHALSRRAREELADIDLTAAIIRRTAELSAEPLEAHRALVELFRETGRTQELMSELLTVADLCVARDESDAAIEAWEEQARLTEEAGRIDEALRTLAVLRDVSEEQGESKQASGYELRRARLLRDAKLDLDGAEAALHRSFELAPRLEVADEGAQLARRRDDAPAEADWTERAIRLHAPGRDRARALLALATLFEERLGAPPQAEAAAREALAADPTLEDAGAMLVRLLEREGRLAELASHYEELAANARSPEERVRLFLEAARIYRERAGRPNEAAAAVLAARAARPDDLALTLQCADLLHEVGRVEDAAEFDAILLETDPFRAVVYERHVAWLRQSHQWAELAALMLRRAERQSGVEAAESYLLAAAACREAGASQQVLLCEDQAFDAAPEHAGAWEAVRGRGGDVRRRANLLAQRARAVPEEAVALLRERADALLEAGEALFAAEAFDELLAVAGEDAEALSARAELAAEAGGPLAAQPWDRRLLAAAGQMLPLPVKVKTQLRLGHASLGSGAYRDAADAFEAVVLLDPDGERGHEALSLLSEVHARTQDTDGLYLASLRLAQRAKGDEAEALFRRAAELFEEPAQAIDALVPLARLRPSDGRVVERATAGLQALGRYGEALELYERGAEAVGGAQAAEWLLEAARMVDAEQPDPERAESLREKAAGADPENLIALRALSDAQRRRNDEAGLRASLHRLVERLEDDDERALLELELAVLYRKAGVVPAARSLLEQLIDRGASRAGYAQALDELIGLVDGAAEPAALAKALEARAALTSGEERAALELRAAHAFSEAGEIPAALRLCRDAAAARPSLDALRFLAELQERSGDAAKAARTLVQASELAEAETQGALKVRAVDLLEAAGEREEATELLERIAGEHLDALTSEALSERFTRLGAPALALEHGFPPAMAEGRFEDALVLAEAASDDARAEEALWALCERSPDPALAVRAAQKLLEGGDDALIALLDAVSESSAPELLQVPLTRARELARAGHTRALSHAASRYPLRRAALLRELFELHRDAGRNEAAVEALESLLELEDDLPARSALHLELGELYLHQLEQPEPARGAFELALAEDLGSVAAVRHLVELYANTEAVDRFVAMAERLVQAAGAVAIAPFREQLSDAYESLDRASDAYRVLGELEETPERLRRRAALADRLELHGEALQLRERCTTDLVELNQILAGYANAALVPFAVRLCERLLEANALTPEARRRVAERLAPTPDGAGLAARLWPELLRQMPTDTDGWTLFAEALRGLGRDQAATLADGFGAALSGSTQSAPAAPVTAMARVHHAPFRIEAPAGLLEISLDSMPRLSATVAQVLEALGASTTRVWLHATGGVEAWMLSPNELVIGAGALGAFGPTELGWLCALAMALGPEGERLSRPGPGPELVDAALAAFEACPASLAACRVIARLDERVRGAPHHHEPSRVLVDSATFRAIAVRALDFV